MNIDLESNSCHTKKNTKLSVLPDFLSITEFNLY